jgi:hypothetical protein
MSNLTATAQFGALMAYTKLIPEISAINC